jgi:octaprenyl-diphosphate synthase
VIQSRRIRFESGEHTHFLDLTSRLQGEITNSGLRNGRIHLQSLHTTVGIAINENEPLLLDDLRALLDRLVPIAGPYLHDDFSRRVGIEDDEPVNGHAHCRQILLLPSLTTLVEDGRLVLGRWQSIFAVELDGPRSREIALQLDGEFQSNPNGHATDSESRLIELELARQFEIDPAAVADPMRRLIAAGGKRLRPRLVLMGSKLGDQVGLLSCVTLAAAVELIHNATLVHDDYVDESPFRHGQPTVAALEGPERAIAVGDYYFAKATRMIAELGNREVTKIVASALEAICRAQIDDLSLRGAYPGDRASYVRVVRGKTAALISAACAAGAQLAGAPAHVVDGLSRYGDLMGTAFQMADDIVDFSPTSGKPMGQDVRQRALSLPLIYATGDAEHGQDVQRLLAGALPEADVAQVVELVRTSGALDRVQAEAEGLAESAVAMLDELPLNGLRPQLVDLATSAASRSF